MIEWSCRGFASVRWTKKTTANHGDLFAPGTISETITEYYELPLCAYKFKDIAPVHRLFGPAGGPRGPQFEKHRSARSGKLIINRVSARDSFRPEVRTSAFRARRIGRPISFFFSDRARRAKLIVFSIIIIIIYTTSSAKLTAGGGAVRTGRGRRVRRGSKGRNKGVRQISRH